MIIAEDRRAARKLLASAVSAGSIAKAFAAARAQERERCAATADEAADGAGRQFKAGKQKTDDVEDAVTITARSIAAAIRRKGRSYRSG